MKTLAGFANTAGGKVVIGVTDDKQVIGVDDPFLEEERICSMIADTIAPRLVPNIEFITYEDKTLIIIEVFSSSLRPHYIRSEGQYDGVYVRLGSTNRKADMQMIDELRRSVSGGSFDSMPCIGISKEDLRLDEIREDLERTEQLSDKELMTLKLLVKYQGSLVPSNGAVILYGSNRLDRFPDVWIQCGRFRGLSKSDIFDQTEIHESLPQAVESIILFLKKHAYKSADFSSIRRKDIWSIPVESLREIIINALVHSDYSQRGAPIRIAFYDDRIEVENPGILLPGMTVEDMKSGVSKIRNTVIARIFKELNLIEQWGSGLKRVFEAAKKQNLPEPVIQELGMRMRITVSLTKKHTIGEAQVSKERPESRPESRPKSVLEKEFHSRLAARIVVFLAQQEFGKHELASLLGHTSVSGELKKQVTNLLDSQYIEMTIPEKPNSRLQKYRLTVAGRSLLHKLEEGTK